eukprot:2930716-Pyramimonas_sp.AAC.1
MRSGRGEPSHAPDFGAECILYGFSQRVSWPVRSKECEAPLAVPTENYCKEDTVERRPRMLQIRGEH